MTRAEKEAYCVRLLQERAAELGRLPLKADFEPRERSRIKGVLGPWPRALERAELKPVSEVWLRRREAARLKRTAQRERRRQHHRDNRRQSKKPAEGEGTGEAQEAEKSVELMDEQRRTERVQS
jgi:hypothetical protein